MSTRVGARLAALTATLCLLGALPVAAGAKTYEPPGKAGATEYAETIPSAGGNVKPPKATVYTGTATPTGSAPITQLGAGVKGLQADAKLGTSGQEAAGFAQSTAPAVVKVAPSAQPSAAHGSGSGSGSALSAVAHLLGGDDGGGIGVFLPLALAFSLGLACGVGALRLYRPARA